MINVFICLMFPMLLLPWCTHSIYMKDGSTRGLFIPIGIFGSLYVIVSVGKSAIICVSSKGPMCGM